MVSISYRYNTKAIADYFQACFVSIEALLDTFEPNTEYAESTEQMVVFNVGNALQVLTTQETISRHCYDLHIDLSLVPDVLLIWNMRRLKHGRGDIFSFYLQMLKSSLILNFTDPVIIVGWKTEAERREAIRGAANVPNGIDH